MRGIGVVAAALALGIIATACGWSPPPAAPTTSVACTPADGPTADAVAAEVGKLPKGPAWQEVSRGHAADCRLHWVVVTSGDAPDSPQQVMFFDRGAPLGAPTSDPRTYITVTPTGNDSATVQYQWRQGNEPACCPTGIGSVRVTIADGKLKLLDPVPSQ
jgi:hypothetical protein